MEFNPSKLSVFALTCGKRVRWVRLITGGLLGIGQWHEDRDHVLRRVRTAIAQRGAAHFATTTAEEAALGTFDASSGSEAAADAADVAAGSGAGRTVAAAAAAVEGSPSPLLAGGGMTDGRSSGRSVRIHPEGGKGERMV